MTLCLVSLTVLSTLGGLILFHAFHVAPALSSDPGAETTSAVGLIRLGRSWGGSGREAIDDGSISSLIEMLKRLGCQVSPVFVYGEDEEKRVSIGLTDYYVRSGFMGVSSDYAEIAGSSLEVIEGRFFDSDEVDSVTRVAVVGSSIGSLVHESAGSHLPAQLSIAGIEYEVVGVVAAGPEFRSRRGDVTGDEAVILPYTTLVEDVVGTADYRLDLYAVVYKRSESVTAEFIDRVINDWLRQADLISSRYVSHFYSQPLDPAGVHTAPMSLAGSIALLVWAAVFAVLPAVALGYLRMSQRAGEMRLMSMVGASPLYLAAQVALETLALTLLGSMVGLALSFPIVPPTLESLELALAAGVVWFVSSCAGGLRFISLSGS